MRLLPTLSSFLLPFFFRRRLLARGGLSAPRFFRRNEATWDPTLDVVRSSCKPSRSIAISILVKSLGGFFSKTWKPKKTRQIKGPAVISRDDSFKRRANHLEQREKLGLSSSPVGKSNPQKYSDPTNAMEKVQVEKDKQDNALSDLSDVLGQLKGMALDMGSEIDRQNKAMDGLQDDVEELNSRVKGANQRARRLLGK